MHLHRPGGQPASGPRTRSNPGDNAWVLTSSALVLMMTGPGLALFYCGLVRKKNVLSVMMQCIFLMCLMTVIWAIYGFALSFGNDPAAGKRIRQAPAYGSWIGYIGDVKYYLCMNHVTPTWDHNGGKLENDGKPSGAPRMETSPDMKVPTASFMLFQCMFFIITPALICGAFAERMKFSTMVVFMILWGTLIYCPLAHWVGAEGFCLREQVRDGHFFRRGLGFCRRNGGAYQFRRFGLDLRLAVGQTPGLRQDGHAAA